MTIMPTVGRVVWYWPEKSDRGTQPQAALIVHVHGENMVNLAWFDSNGVARNSTSVQLFHDPAQKRPDWKYCEWMPYQLGQAAKTDEAQRLAGLAKEAEAIRSAKLAATT